MRVSGFCLGQQIVGLRRLRPQNFRYRLSLETGLDDCMVSSWFKRHSNAEVGKFLPCLLQPFDDAGLIGDAPLSVCVTQQVLALPIAELATSVGQVD